MNDGDEAIRQAKALIALNSMRIRAARNGYKTNDGKMPLLCLQRA